MNQQMDVRWKQRFANYQKALSQLERFPARNMLNEFEIQGLIKAFEYTFELAWKTLQDFLEEIAAYPDIKGPRPVIMKAFQDGYLTHGESWMSMLKDRNRTVHTYDQATASEIADAITKEYMPLFAALNKKLEGFLQKK
ncbi:MAG: nucleotidyltransferase substrate binding protein [Bacteroidales bacterium]|nr:nucleotidyltransferase substrate binding protein [Bacteroidales bacterium]